MGSLFPLVRRKLAAHFVTHKPTACTIEAEVELLTRKEHVVTTETETRKRLYIVQRTTTERYFYDPVKIRASFGTALATWEAQGGSFEDFVIETFEAHEDSRFGMEFFYGAEPDTGVELAEMWDDE